MQKKRSFEEAHECQVRELLKNGQGSDCFLCFRNSFTITHAPRTNRLSRLALLTPSP